MQKYVILDFETRSEVDLKLVGAYEYSKHPTTQILCAAWCVGTKRDIASAPIRSWSPAIHSRENDLALDHLVSELKNPENIIVAHNAFFEQVIIKNVLSRRALLVRDLPISRFMCTAAQARALALPGNLEGACAALNLPVQKDMVGRRLILKYCKPRTLTKHDSRKWHDSKADLMRIIEYCKTDVKAETLLFLNTPELSPDERATWLLDQEINFRGFKVDRELVEKTSGLIEKEFEILRRELFELTGGLFSDTNRRAAILEWLGANGLRLPDLTAKTVSDAISTGFAKGKCRRVLEIRQAFAKTSVAKYSALEMRSRTDGRVRDNLVYHAASTGRWGGAGFQPQNIPRGTIKNTDLAAEILGENDLELVRLIYGEPMSVFTSCIRSMIVPSDGTRFFDGDFNAIEARVLFWFADHAAGLKMYSENADLYRELASIIYRVKPENVSAEQRDLGKRAILGCGYGMGKKKFFDTCKLWGQEISQDLAETAVNAYRDIHSPVPKLWSSIERAAVFAVKNPGKIARINKTTWFTSGDFLWCELPSTRKLAFYKPRIKYDVPKWGGDKRPTLYHWGLNSMTKKWVEASTYGGKLVENIVQATARDLMRDAMLRVSKNGYSVVLSVHDELLAEKPGGSVDEFLALMSIVPKWAEGLPVKVGGWAGLRYKK